MQLFTFCFFLFILALGAPTLSSDVDPLSNLVSNLKSLKLFDIELIESLTPEAITSYAYEIPYVIAYPVLQFHFGACIPSYEITTMLIKSAPQETKGPLAPSNLKVASPAQKLCSESTNKDENSSPVQFEFILKESFLECNGCYLSLEIKDTKSRAFAFLLLKLVTNISIYPYVLDNMEDIIETIKIQGETFRVTDSVSNRNKFATLVYNLQDSKIYMEIQIEHKNDLDRSATCDGYIYGRRSLNDTMAEWNKFPSSPGMFALFQSKPANESEWIVHYDYTNYIELNRELFKLPNPAFYISCSTNEKMGYLDIPLIFEDGSKLEGTTEKSQLISGNEIERKVSLKKVFGGRKLWIASIFTAMECPALFQLTLPREIVFAAGEHDTTLHYQEDPMEFHPNKFRDGPSRVNFIQRQDVLVKYVKHFSVLGISIPVTNLTTEFIPGKEFNWYLDVDFRIPYSLEFHENTTQHYFSVQAIVWPEYGDTSQITVEGHPKACLFQKECLTSYMEGKNMVKGVETPNDLGSRLIELKFLISTPSHYGIWSIFFRPKFTLISVLSMFKEDQLTEKRSLMLKYFKEMSINGVKVYSHQLRAKCEHSDIFDIHVDAYEIPFKFKSNEATHLHELVVKVAPKPFATHTSSFESTPDSIPPRLFPTFSTSETILVPLVDIFGKKKRCNEFRNEIVHLHFEYWDLFRKKETRCLRARFLLPSYRFCSFQSISEIRTVPITDIVKQETRTPMTRSKTSILNILVQLVETDPATDFGVDALLASNPMTSHFIEMKRKFHVLLSKILQRMSSFTIMESKFRREELKNLRDSTFQFLETGEIRASYNHVYGLKTLLSAILDVCFYIHQQPKFLTLMSNSWYSHRNYRIYLNRIEAVQYDQYLNFVTHVLTLCSNVQLVI